MREEVTEASSNNGLRRWGYDAVKGNGRANCFALRLARKGPLEPPGPRSPLLRCGRERSPRLLVERVSVEARDYVDVVVPYILPPGRLVVLPDSYAVALQDVFQGQGEAFGKAVHRAQEIVRKFVKVFVSLVRNHQG